MLEGLEISEILKSELERTVRIDSEFYAKDNLNSLEVLESKSARPLTDLLKVSDGNHMSISEHYTENGIPYYRGGDIYNFFIEQTSNPLTIPEKLYSYTNMKRSHLNKGDVLISIVGAIIGNLSLVKTQTKATCSCKLAILRPKEIESEFVAIFLKSKYGQNQIQKFRRGTGQTGLILEDFDQLLIPQLEISFRKEIKALVDSSFNKIDTSIYKYGQAENLLLQNIGLKDFRPNQEAVNIKSFKNSFLQSGRLDAEYYQVKYENYENAINCKKHTFIKDEYIHIKNTCGRDKDGYHYIEIGDVNVSDGSNNSNYVLTKDLPANAKTLAKKGDLLISNVRPYRGAVSIIENDFHNNLIVSGAFTVLRKQENSIFNNEVLKVLLRTEVYKDWLLKFNVGTSYPVIKDEDVLKLSIPIIELTIQTQIASLIQESFKLKAESEKLLTVAKIAVETAIEQSEEVAVTYIKGEIKTDA